MNRTIYYILVFVLITNICYSQQKKVKWGKVSDEEIEMESVSYEQQANAVILSSIGDLSFGQSCNRQTCSN